MCGIVVIVEGAAVQLDDELLTGDVADRPTEAADFQLGLQRRGPDSQGELDVQAGPARLHFEGSLLQLRGSEPSITPLCNATSGNVLLFNGEVFGGVDVATGASDALALLAALSPSPPAQPQDIGARVCHIVSSLRGPWALAFWHDATQTLWFGRDVLGRRSLLVHLPRPGDGRFMLASVAPLDPGVPFEGFTEVTPGMYSLEFDGYGAGRLTPRPWADPAVAALAAFERPLESLERRERREADAGGSPDDNSEEAAVEAATDAVLAALRRSVAVRCRCIDRPATLEDDAYRETRAEPHLPSNPLSLAPARVLILFSGGVDSTLLAVLAHEALPPGEPIDLACICFAGGTSPDRLAALDALEELRAAAPGRPWRLIGIDGSLAEVESAAPRLRRLLAPADTVMDLNIGAALWLAAEADGVLLGGADGNAAAPQRYRSAARVVLLGHGADELFAGYARHRTRFRAASWRGLAAELALDVRRLWRRNLGRDDRLVADRGREARHPFLDERVVAAALALPLPALADLALAPGTGDKRVLRRALARLGLPRAAARVKRAIQFGSRLAKAQNAAHFGGTRQANARGAGGVKLAQLALAGDD